MTSLPDPWPAPRATHPVDAVVSLPGSKSLTNRALVLAAIADGPSVVRRALRSRDTSLMAAALTSLGATRRHVGRGLGRDARGLRPRRRRRLRPGRHRDAVRAAGGGAVARAPSPSTATSTCGSARSAQVLARAARPRCLDRRATPCRSRCTGRGSVPGGVVVVDASRPRRSSSPRCCWPVRGTTPASTCATTASRCPSLPHIDMTSRCCASTASRSTTPTPTAGGSRPARSRPVDHVIEPDLSNAAPFLGAGRRVRRLGDGRATGRTRPTRPATRCARSSSDDGLRGQLVDGGSAGHRLRHAARHRRRPARRRRAHPGRRGAVRARRADPRTCAASPTSAATRPTAWPRSRPSWAALGADVTEHADGLQHPARLPCTAGCSTPTPTTGWRTPA